MDAAAWEQAKAIITAALRRPPAEREQFVREQGGDTPLAGEIITMLAGYAGTDFLADTAAVDPGEESDDIQPGMKIGPYVIVDSIGRGGMGHVFLGNDPRLRRKVALKCVIRSLAADDASKKRIRAEARAAARVAHPNVATIHDVVEHEDRAFIVMEYVEGESLAARLRRERLPIDRVLAIGRQLASALTAAHTRGIVHRDLKPANVQITPEGGVKVLDFGIAHAPRHPTTIASAATTNLAATVAPARLGQAGTPPYMAPEQLIGRPGDERSDVYSLGVVLFEMATGKRPYKETDTADLVVAQAKGVPRADVTDPRVPHLLADVIAKALAVDLDARFQTAADVDAALAGVERVLAAQIEPIVRKIARVAVGVVMVPIVLAGVGLAATTGFNITFSLQGPFASESWRTTLLWGLKAVGPSLVFMLLTAVVILAIRFVIRVAMLLPSVSRLADRLAAQASKLNTQINLEDPAVLAQALAALGLLAVATMAWTHSALIAAWANYVNTASLEKLVPLAPANVAERSAYRIELDVLVLAFSVGLFRVLHLRRRDRTRGGQHTVALVAAIVVLLVLMNEWPYRIFFHNEFERVDYSGARCYIIADSALEYLLFCPDNPAPRNRTIRHDDPQLRRLGIVESVFTTLK
jgi:predicted Ser/Thr protein kinase